MNRILVVLLVLSASILGCDPKEQSADLPSIEEGVADLQKEMSKNFTLSDEQKTMMGDAAADLEAALPSPGLKAGEKAPDFTLPNSMGNDVSLSKSLEEGPVVLTFYRGGWCVYCNIELHALQQSMSEIEKYNATVLAVTPQKLGKSVEQQEKNTFDFQLLSDLDNKVMKDYKVHFEIGDQLNRLYKDDFKIDLDDYNGKGRRDLPIPGTFIIGQDGIVKAAFADIDYTKRMEPAAIVEALKRIE
jgi:peroxiredoxin